MLRSALVWLGFSSPEKSVRGTGHGQDHAQGGRHGHTHGVIDPTIATTAKGIWAIKWSFVILAITAALQLAWSLPPAASRCWRTQYITWGTL